LVTFVKKRKYSTEILPERCAMLTQTKRYPYSPIIRREPMRFPDGARVAIVPYLNIEHFPEDRPGTPLVPLTANFKPDVMNYAWRDYGQRIGIWRIMEMLDRCGMRATVCLNSDVCREYPEIIEEGNKRDWVWMGHAQNNSYFLTDIDETREREIISDTLDTIEKSAGRRSKGWLSPALTETYNTPELLAEYGVEYVCDWTCDDQPFEMNVKSGSLISMPYSLEMNDIQVFLSLGLSGEAFGQMIIDQFDVLYEEGKTNSRVMPIVLHTFFVGQAFRAKHLARAFEHIVSHSDIWLPTGDEINDWYRQTHLSA